MIFAAGLGIRLRPLTERIPKSLIEVAGVPMLERVARRLVAAGADRLIVNMHHEADRIEGFVRAHDGFGVDVVFSREPDAPLETGGGLLRAAPLFRREAPFFLHNCDVVTDFDLRAMYDAHGGADALASVAVQDRSASRYLLFDAQGLCGREDTRSGKTTWARTPTGPVARLGFCGVHVARPELLNRIREQGVFSIFETYLRLAAEGAVIRPHRIDGARWIDIGTLERLEEAGKIAAEFGI
ncbi:MAG: NTP transferase domain-containing protein [Gemmatimonadetes bacterium]|nr:NTP transferase domain-containing protein [Gemmatimonadota bacterium]